MSDHRTFIYFCLFIFLFNFFVQEIVSSFYISLLNLLSRGYDKVSDQMGEGVSLGFVFPFCPVFFFIIINPLTREMTRCLPILDCTRYRKHVLEISFLRYSNNNSAIHKLCLQARKRKWS